MKNLYLLRQLYSLFYPSSLRLSSHLISPHLFCNIKKSEREAEAAALCSNSTNSAVNSGLEESWFNWSQQLPPHRARDCHEVADEDQLLVELSLFNQSLPSYSRLSPSSVDSVLASNRPAVLRNEALERMVPVRDPLSTVIPMTLVYTIIFITGVIGNVCTCIVIARNKYMHTTVNYYLFSLAMSDLLLLVLGLPQELWTLWQKYPYVFGEVFCITRGLTSETSTNASVLTITAFTVERYLAICHPLKSHTMSKLSRVVRLIIIIWVLAALGAIPLAVQFGIKYEHETDGLPDPESAACTLKRQFPHAFETSTFIFFVIPVTLISILYLLIGIQLRRSEAISKSQGFSDRAEEKELSPNKKGTHLAPALPNNGSIIAKNGSIYTKFKTRKSWEGRSTSARHSNSVSSRRAVIKMLISVVVAFVVCWSPFHCQRLMAIYVKTPTPAEEVIFQILTYISGVTYYVSATINPILYSIMSLKFRQAFKDTLGRCCGRRPQGPRFGKFGSGYSSRFNSTIRSSAGNETDVTHVSEASRERNGSCRMASISTTRLSSFDSCASALMVGPLSVSPPEGDREGAGDATETKPIAISIAL